MQFDQLFDLLLYDCELEGEVVLPCQHFDDLAESQAGPEDVVNRGDELLRLGQGANVTIFCCLRDDLHLPPAASKVLQEQLDHNRIHFHKLSYRLSIYNLEKSGKEHRVYPKLFAVNRCLNPLNNLLVLRFPTDSATDLGRIGLPLQLLAFLDDVMNISCVNAANEGLDLVGLRNELVILIVLIGVLAIKQRQILNFLHQLRLPLQPLLPLIQVQFPDQLQQVSVELVVALIPPRPIEGHDTLFELHDSAQS